MDHSSFIEAKESGKIKTVLNIYHGFMKVYYLGEKQNQNIYGTQKDS